jgi:hypothetical protein
MSSPIQPVLGMVLKGYPRISETFISNEILLLEKLGFRIHLFSMRQPRENFSHASVSKIRANVDYLPETLLKPLPRLMYHNCLLAAQKPNVYADALKIAYHNNAFACPLCPFADIGRHVYQQIKRAAI